MVEYGCDRDYDNKSDMLHHETSRASKPKTLKIKEGSRFD